MAFELLIKNKASTQDVVALIIKIINVESQSPFIKKVVASIQSNTVHFLKRLFDYVCSHVDYQRDPEGHEKVMLPERLVREGTGDCKKMTTLIAAALQAIGVQPLIKLISYNGEDWEHIYVIVPYPADPKGYIVLDPVNNCQFNKEFSHKKSLLFNLNGQQMNKLSLLGAMPDTSNKRNSLSETAVSGICEVDDLIGSIAGVNPSAMPASQEQQILAHLAYGAQEALIATRGKGTLIDPIIATRGKGGEIIVNPPRQPASEQIGRRRIRNPFTGIFQGGNTNGRRILQAVATVGLAPARGAFLAIVSLNALKIGSKLAVGWNKDSAKIKNWWQSLGGNPSLLRTAIERGSKQTLIAGPRNRIAVRIEGVGSISLAALIATATPLIVAVIALLKQIGTISPADNEAIGQAGNDLENVSNQPADDEIDLPSDEDEGLDDGKKKDEKETSVAPWLVGGLLALKLLA